MQVEAEATHIPEYIEVDIQGAPIGTQVHASDLILPDGTTLLSDEDLLIVNVTQMQSEEEAEAELEEAEAEAGIEREEHEEAIEPAEAPAEDAAGRRHRGVTPTSSLDRDGSAEQESVLPSRLRSGILLP